MSGNSNSVVGNLNMLCDCKGNEMNWRYNSAVTVRYEVEYARIRSKKYFLNCVLRGDKEQNCTV
jgi:hypothetical protein